MLANFSAREQIDLPAVRDAHAGEAHLLFLRARVDQGRPQAFQVRVGRNVQTPGHGILCPFAMCPRAKPQAAGTAATMAAPAGARCRKRRRLTLADSAMLKSYSTGMPAHNLGSAATHESTPLCLVPPPGAILPAADSADHSSTSPGGHYEESVLSSQIPQDHVVGCVGHGREHVQLRPGSLEPMTEYPSGSSGAVCGDKAAI